MQDYSLISVIKSLHRWRKPVVLITGTTAVLTVIIALLLPNYYRSQTVFYAASQDLFKPQKIFGVSQAEMYYYGGREDVERIITASVSRQVTDHLIDRFHLYEHYKIRPGSPRAEHNVRKRLLKRYKVVRTKYDALELTVEDRNPQMAAAIANGARDRINDLVIGIIQESQRSLMVSYAHALTSKETAFRTISDSLQYFQSEYGIFDPENQTEYLSMLITSIETQLVRDRGMLMSYERMRNAKGIQDSIIRLQATIYGLEQQLELLKGPDTAATSNYNFERFTSGKVQVERFGDAYRKALHMINTDKEQLKQMEVANALDAPAVHLVEEATVPVVKARPKRSLIVLGATFAAFLFSLIGVLLIDSLRGYDWSFLKW